ncbi:MAG: MBL fold metallo-hydrolase [Syntrophales bacterium]
MLEIAKNIFFVPGDNKSRFPYCTCLYIRGRDMRILIDAGMGKKGMDACRKEGIDVLILTHCHYDHRSSITQILEIPVWCHGEEVPYLEDRELYIRATGMSRSGLDFTQLLKNLSFPRILVQKRLSDAERIDAGGATMEVIHAPGHTPGHIAFYFPEHELLFSADVALDPFGPFYGNEFSDIADFIASIRRLKALPVKTVLSSHCGPFTEGLEKRFTDYENIIYKRDRLVMDRLKEPRTLSDFFDRNMLYANYPRPTRVMKWLELIHVEKHLERLVSMGLIEKKGDIFSRVGGWS